MNLTIETENGWTEAIIDNDCEFGKFYKSAEILGKDFNLTFSEIINDFDTIYQDFEYNSAKLVLHYNIYLGITIFPRASKSANQFENNMVLEISKLLFQKLLNLDWSEYENGNTVGTKGSEGGTIIQDIENSNGARITLEKESGNIPFAITIGIYGLMVNTYYESDLVNVRELISLTKNRINKIFELAEVPEDKRDDYWYSKYNKRISELA